MKKLFRSRENRMICGVSEVLRSILISIRRWYGSAGCLLQHAVLEPGSLHILWRQSLCRMHEFLIIPETVLTNPFLPDMIVFS